MEAKLLSTFDAGDGFTFRVYEIVKRGSPAYSVGLWGADGAPVLIGGAGCVRHYPDRERALYFAEARAIAAMEMLSEPDCVYISTEEAE